MDVFLVPRSDIYVFDYIFEHIATNKWSIARPQPLSLYFYLTAANISGTQQFTCNQGKAIQA